MHCKRMMYVLLQFIHYNASDAATRVCLAIHKGRRGTFAVRSFVHVVINSRKQAAAKKIIITQHKQSRAAAKQNSQLQFYSFVPS